MLPDIGAPPVDVPGAETLPSSQLVPDLIAGPDFAEVDVGSLCSSASNKNKCERRDMTFKAVTTRM